MHKEEVCLRNKCILYDSSSFIPYKASWDLLCGKQWQISKHLFLWKKVRKVNVVKPSKKVSKDFVKVFFLYILLCRIPLVLFIFHNVTLKINVNDTKASPLFGCHQHLKHKYYMKASGQRHIKSYIKYLQELTCVS